MTLVTMDALIIAKFAKKVEIGGIGTAMAAINVNTGSLSPVQNVHLLCTLSNVTVGDRVKHKILEKLIYRNHCFTKFLFTVNIINFVVMYLWHAQHKERNIVAFDPLCSVFVFKLAKVFVGNNVPNVAGRSALQSWDVGKVEAQIFSAITAV